jgi:prepilin-type N-terminal cleavage/methylation domain-containing protein
MLPAPCSLPHKRSAFTLIELLVVIAIIAILAGLSLAVMGGVQQTTRKTEVRAMAHQIKAALSSYYAEYGIYPTNVRTDENFHRMITGAATNQNRRGINFLSVPNKFLNAESGVNSAIVTPPKFYAGTARSNFLIVTDGMTQGTDRPYDGNVTLPTGKSVPGGVAVYVRDPNKQGEDAWVGTW